VTAMSFNYLEKYSSRGWSASLCVIAPGFEFEAERGSNEGSSQSRKEIEVRPVKRTIGRVPRAISPVIRVEKAQHEAP
jgi:hypothetical protein